MKEALIIGLVAMCFVLSPVFGYGVWVGVKALLIWFGTDYGTAREIALGCMILLGTGVVTTFLVRLAP